MNVALLLTDIVDSTKLNETLGDAAMATLWTRHDRVARDLLGRHRGREIDRTDGFLLLFDDPADAVAWAFAFHRALRALDLRARIGVHVGPVILLENSPSDVALGAKPVELEGLSKPTAARVMALAMPGQTLLTAEAAAALGDPTVRSHGHWMLKGVLAPVELFEAGIPGESPLAPPPDAPKAWRVVRRNDAWVPLREVRHSLPRERDVFVAREADLHALAARLDDGAALVTVLGIGGAGKTRLVTHYGWTWLGSWPGGVWFCDLSDARSVDDIVFAVAGALDVPLGNDPVSQLGHAIAGRGRCLVILDNFEQITRYAADTLGRWLDRCTVAQFVVTTREVLGLPGEFALALSPLSRDEAAALFLRRAEAAKRDFRPSAEDVATIQRLVELLDRLPLAIELAAARVRMMPPKALLARMGHRFELLTSSNGRRDRQATLRAALDWSWELLSATEQSALAQLAVFEGGFTLEAAEAVLDVPDGWPGDVLQALIDKSLVRVSDDRGETRMDLLISVHDYANERLGAGRAAAELRHGVYYAGSGADEAISALQSHGGVARRLALGAEVGNITAACRRAVHRGDGPTATATLSALWAVLELRGPFLTAVALGQQVLGLSALSARGRAQAARVVGRAQSRAGRAVDALTQLVAALDLARAAGDRPLEVKILGNLGAVHLEQGRMDDARACSESAIALARQQGDRRSEGLFLSNLGLVHRAQGRMDEARVAFDASLAIAREVGERRSEGVVLGNLGLLHMDQGRMDEARWRFEAALAIAREVGDRRYEGMTQGNLGNVLAEQGHLDAARAHFEAAIAVAREVGERRSEGVNLGHLGMVCFERGEIADAERHLQAAIVITAEAGAIRFEAINRGNLGVLYLDQGRLDDARGHFEHTLAVAGQIGDLRLEGAFLGHLGHLHARSGRLDEAHQAFAAGEERLRLARDEIELGKLACRRGACEIDGGDLAAARASLATSEGCAARAGVGSASELGHLVSALRARLSAV